MICGRIVPKHVRMSINSTTICFLQSRAVVSDSRISAITVLVDRFGVDPCVNTRYGFAPSPIVLYSSIHLRSVIIFMKCILSEQARSSTPPK